jgi:hypothetical protein
MTAKQIREIINSCKTCQDLEFKEELANNDRLPIEIWHKAGQAFDDHLFSHFEEDMK